MRIAIRYSDGEYTMYDPSKQAFATGVDIDEWMANNTIEISQSEWTEYQVFLIEGRKWYRRLQALDEKMRDK